MGGIIGIDEGTTGGAKINNCYFDGNIITSDNTRIGGISGGGATIENCGVRGNISGRMYVGGITGDLFIVNSIRNSYFDGNVSGYQFIGGLVGFNKGNIENSYSSGYVSQSRYASQFD